MLKDFTGQTELLWVQRVAWMSKMDLDSNLGHFWVIFLRNDLYQKTESNEPFLLWYKNCFLSCTLVQHGIIHLCKALIRVQKISSSCFSLEKKASHGNWKKERNVKLKNKKKKKKRKKNVFMLITTTKQLQSRPNKFQQLLCAMSKWFTLCCILRLYFLL